MTEVPEHLLRRSRERREALGLESSSPQSPAPSTPGGTQGMSAATPEAPATAAAASEAKPAPVSAPVPEPPVEEEEAVPTIAPVLEAARRTKIPVWVVPVLLFLLPWSYLYVGAFGDRTVKKEVTPKDVYAKAGCTSCHGASGEGGVGPALAGGQAKLTFPAEADHVNWVKNGSAPVSGQKYGDPNRPGGQHGPATGGMPAFGSQLSDAEIQMVVKYERDGL